MIAGFVAEARRDRLRAIRDAAAGSDVEALACALRRVLFTDADAAVRAAAAARLGELGREAWLVDALVDHSPLVREAILRALARCGTPRATDPVRRLVETERLWWVRRTAVYALAADAPSIAKTTPARIVGTVTGTSGSAVVSTWPDASTGA